MKNTDFLIIGSGIAGLYLALKAAKHGDVLIITKANDDESNTKYAQGGIAGVFAEHDTYEKHIRDTLIAGDGLCDEEVVETVVKEGPGRIREVAGMGAVFDRDSAGNYDLAMEGGHSEKRVLHAKDTTGAEIERALLRQVYDHPRITMHNHYFGIELITQHHLGQEESEPIECYGLYALNLRTNAVETILAKVTVLATGGAGQVYKTTTNPLIATGDGIAMAHRAGAKIRNMEFIQFHPTALYPNNESPAFLISEALRGAGAILRNHDYEEFMFKYDSRGSLASRDVVAKAIDTEMKKAGVEFVYLDARHIDKSVLTGHFPNIYAKCISRGIDLTTEMIPVTPAAHYICGGIKTDLHGRTTISNLYACGECASTGLHGSNRLASNSLLEALVFAHRIAGHATPLVESNSFRYEVPGWNDRGTSLNEEEILVAHNRTELQAVMTNYVGIVRSDIRLNRAMRRLELLSEETEDLYKKSKLSVALCELRNLVQVASIIVTSAMKRKESRGLHFNSDHPAKSAEKIETIV